MKRNIITGFLILIIIFLIYTIWLTIHSADTFDPRPNEQVIKFPTTPVTTTNTSLAKQTYTNPTIGLYFEYPFDWKLDENADSEEGSITHGDIMKDGKIYTSFSRGLFPPDWQTSTTPYISISHSPLAGPDGKSYDNLSISEQFKNLYCGKDCNMSTNKNGVKYLASKGCDGRQGCYVSATIPTGKYIMTFTLVGDSMHNFQLNSPVVNIFSDLINTIQLK